MKKIVSGILMTCVIVLISFHAMAQETPKGRWWNTPSVAKTLNLTGDEIEQLDADYSRHDITLGLIENEIEYAKLELKKLNTNPERNKAAIKKYTGELEKFQSARDDAKTSFTPHVRKFLGEARFKKLVGLNP